ncbi:MAG: DUF3054 domain-containing protein [Chloroflexota bacterium]
MRGFSVGSVRWTARWTPILGDAAAFLLFAGLGRNQHHESGGALMTLVIAAPFLAAWFAVAGFLGLLGNAWLRRGAVGSLKLVGIAWLIAWPIALLLRAVLQRRGVTLSFALVALIVNAIFLVGWRGAYLFVVHRTWRGAAGNR